MTAVDRRKGFAGVLQWTAYLCVSTLLGLLWYPVAIFADGLPAFLHHEEILTLKASDLEWVLIAGLIGGLLVRGMTVIRKKVPLAWLSIFFPFIGLAAKTIVELRLSQTSEKLNAFTFSPIVSVCAFIIASWLVVPLAVPYLHLLRWVHETLERWETRATRRGVRHFAWALACAGFLGATEGPRFLAFYKDRKSSSLVYDLGIVLPPGTELVGTGEGPGDFDSVPSYWFRRKGAFDWPVVANAQPLTSPDDAVDIEWRAVKSKIREGKVSKYAQAKWYVEGRTIQATLIRDPEGDYLEIIPW